MDKHGYYTTDPLPTNIMKIASLIKLSRCKMSLSLMYLITNYFFIAPGYAADIYHWTDDNNHPQLSDIPPLRSKAKNLIIVHQHTQAKIPPSKKVSKFNNKNALKTELAQNLKLKNCLILQTNLDNIMKNKLILNKHKKIVKLTKPQREKLVKKLEKYIKYSC